MSIRSFDVALAARRDPGITSALGELAPFLDLCRHAVARQAFGSKSLAWSASREPIGLSIQFKSETIWSAIGGEPGGKWLVSSDGSSARLTKNDAVAHLARVLATAATMIDGVRFTWRKDDTIGGAF